MKLLVQSDAGARAAFTDISNDFAFSSETSEASGRWISAHQPSVFRPSIIYPSGQKVYIQESSKVRDIILKKCWLNWSAYATIDACARPGGPLVT